MVKLSILAQSPIRTGGSHEEAIAETFELARTTDCLGYFRYCVVEHHNSPSLACTAPEILISRIASITAHLRVGAGGIMMTHYSPLKVAETFRMLETLYPGRIDMSVGRAPGKYRCTASALRAGSDGWGAEQYLQQVSDLIEFVSDRIDPAHPFTSVHPIPTGASTPPMWLLGSSDQSTAVVAHFGCGDSVHWK